MYAKVSASTKSYVGRQTASNKENPFMDEVKGTSSSPEYVIRNARHLYNIRFMEALNYDSAQPASAVKYTQKQNVIWGGNDGLVADGFLFDTDSVISGSKTSAVLEPDAPYYIPGAGTTSQSLDRIQNMPIFRQSPSLVIIVPFRRKLCLAGAIMSKCSH